MGDPVAQTGPTIPHWEATIPTELPDLKALPVARTATGETATMRLLYSHLLLVGATGSGKGSVLWSIFRTLAPGIKDRTVELWGIDPKGGMEFGAGETMFSRLVGHEDDPDAAIAELLVDAYKMMRARARHMKTTGTRKFTPTPGEPVYVIAIDEYLQLAMTITDPKKRDIVNKMLVRLLSQGRACGFVIIAACQLAQKEALKAIRDLFPLRVCLRATDADMVDMTLGDGARKRGAMADMIPEGDAHAGTGYMNLDDRTPVLVRFPWASDMFIEAMAAAYPAPVADPEDVAPAPAAPGPALVELPPAPAPQEPTKREKATALIDAGWTNPQRIATEAGCTDRFVRTLLAERKNAGTRAGRGGPHQVEATSTPASGQDHPTRASSASDPHGPEQAVGTPEPVPELRSGTEPSTRRQIHPDTDTHHPYGMGVPDPLRAAP